MSKLKQELKTKAKQTPLQIMLNRLLVPIVELEKAVQDELERNPLLEEDMAEDEDSPIDDTLSNTVSADDFEQSLDDIEQELDKEESERRDFSDESEQDSYDDDYSYRERQEIDKNSNGSKELFVSSSSTLYDDLIDQLTLQDLDPEERAIAQELIGSIDERGFLSRDISIIANDMAFKRRIETTESEVERILKILQMFEPAGVGARSEQECLSLQLHRLRPRTESNNNATLIIDKYYSDLTKKHYNEIQHALCINADQLEEALSVIRHLSLSPAIAYSELEHDTIVPDFVVTRNNNSLELTINNDHMPKLHISHVYTETLKDLMQQKRKDPGTLDAINFIKDHTEDAQLFIDALKLRGDAMTATMKTIMKHQHKYFLSGDTSDMKPLLQKDVAEETGFDNSTISRIVNSKYVQTDFGLVKLDAFFSHGLTNNEGIDVASAAIKDYLKQLVDNEDKSKPYTDEVLATLLNQHGYKAARRTVEKYRQMLNIPSSRLRKEIKK